MAGDWIPIRTDLLEDPSVIAIARSVKLDEFAVVGRLIKLWSFLSHQTTDGSLPGVDEQYIDTICRRRGFTQAVVEAGWLGRNAAGELQACRYDRWMAESAKKRLDDSRRQRRRRSGPSPPGVVTKVCDNLSSLSSISVVEGSGGPGEKEEGMPSASDRWISFCEQLAVASPGCPQWYPPWAAKHAGAFGLARDNDPQVMADWWEDAFAKKKVTEKELKEASAMLLVSAKHPKGRAEHPRMLLEIVGRLRQPRRLPEQSQTPSLASKEAKKEFHLAVGDFKKGVVGNIQKRKEPVNGKA